MNTRPRTNWRFLATGSAGLAILIGGLIFLQATDAQKKTIRQTVASSAQQKGVYQPTRRKIEVAKPVSIAQVAQLDQSVNYNRPFAADTDEEWTKPSGLRGLGLPIAVTPGSKQVITAPTPSVTGISPPPTQTFKGEYLSGTTIPPDTHGAVGTNFVVTSSNDRLRIQDRNGVQLSRVTINSFWASATVKGVAVASAFDTKVFYDRFNDRFILVSSLNGQNVNSGMGVAVTQTNDPTGTWLRYTNAADLASTASGGHWIDYPSVGFNNNWIVVDENVFNFGTAGTGYFGQQIFVLDKAAAYAGTLASINLFEGPFSTCATGADLGCGFTMAPALVEDNSFATVHLIEDWDNVAGQLRVSKITGTPSTPVLTVGTQFPQSTLSWRFNATRIGTTAGCGGTCSGGYLPQKQQSAHLPSGTRIMANDSRIQNTVYRNGSLWTAHTVMLAATPSPAGTCVGGTSVGCSGAVIDTHSAIQWWQIDPSLETGAATVPFQRGRIEDPAADNCHDGNGGTRTSGACTSTATQVGTFFAFPNISVNLNNDVLIGFTQFSPFTYASSAYAIRRSADLVNTVRDPAVFRGGQANYNIGSGSGSTRQNRWGDYSATQTDPLDDTTFWTAQEYAGATRSDFLGSPAGPWETWWAKISPTTAAASTSGNLIISQFRLRGPQGPTDEFIELYNPSPTPLYVSTTDNSDGWAIAYSSDGTAFTNILDVIPNGTVIPAFGHYLAARNQTGAGGVGIDLGCGGNVACLSTNVYSLNTYPGAGPAPASPPATTLRGADSDNGFGVDNADNGGIAIFKTATQANMTGATRMDSAGFANIAAGLFKEGNGIPTISTTTPAGQYTFYRDLGSGTPQDTGANENDFIFADPVNEVFTVQPRLGAAGPQNLDSPIARASTPMRNFDTTQPTGSDPNQVYDPTPVTNGANGSVLIRRTLVNNTGQPITRLRFRLSSTSTLNGPGAGTLDLRLISSSDSTALTNDPAQCGGAPPCTLTVRGTTLETPPTQALGGGWNSSASAGVVTLAAPIAAGARLNVEFLFGVQTGTPLIESPLAAIPVSVIAESLVPNAALAPTAANVSVSGRVLSADGRGIRGATVTLTSPSGRTVTTTTNAFGYYLFQGVRSGGSYLVNARARGATFQARILSVTDSLTDVDLIAK